MRKPLILALALGASCLHAQDRVVDKKFLAFNGVSVAESVTDIALTQRCKAAHTCTEGNPIMASHPWVVGLSLAAGSTFASYEFKKHGVKAWWVFPAISAGSHTIGIVSGLRF